MSIAILKNTQLVANTTNPLSLVALEGTVASLSTVTTLRALQPLTEQLLGQLVESLSTATATQRQQIEALLTTVLQQHQPLALPYLFKGLLNPSATVTATIVMVLIRNGASIVPALRQFYIAHQHNTWLHHSVGFILDQLSETIATKVAA
jgi:hypothetical protein